MAHEIETMAYAGQTPWHGLGVKVLPDLTPAQMMDEAGVNWRVKRVPAYAEIDGQRIPVGRSALVRESDNSVLDVVGDDWNEFQNEDAFNFFNEFVEAGNCEMHTAGSLKSGRMVWALARIKDTVSFGNGDTAEPYFLFSNPHAYGKSIDVRLTAIRVVCNNTLTLALDATAKNFVKISHRGKFDAEVVKQALGIASARMNEYAEAGAFLRGKNYTAESLVNYFKELFPVITKDAANSNKEFSKTAKTLMGIVDTQPGADLAPGSYWNAFNAVTYFADHLASRTGDTRLYNSWYGTMKDVKTEALQKAVEYANAA